jgi:hypothetical protein
MAMVLFNYKVLQDPHLLGCWRVRKISDEKNDYRSIIQIVTYLAGEITAGSADYRRQARRIRASFSGNSFLTQQALGDLAKRRDLQTRASEPDALRISASLKTNRVKNEHAHLQQRITAVVERGFTEHALSKLQPFGFTFSDRVTLLDAAEKLGISRFRANLILAMHENQAPGRRWAKQSSMQSSGRSGPANAPPRSVASSLLLILSLEILVVAALVWMLIG